MYNRQNKNKALQDEIDAKYAQTYLTDSDKAYVKGLEAQKRDVSVFEQFDFLNVNTKDGNTDDWGEQIDFSVEEILDMPTVCEVQMNLTKKGSVADSDLHSEVDKNVLSEEEAWELFA